MRDFKECFHSCDTILIEGALGLRLRAEYGLEPDPLVANAGFVYQEKGRAALREIYGQYIIIAKRYGLPIMLTTPTRRANRDRAEKSGWGKAVIHDNVSFLKEIRDTYINSDIRSDAKADIRADIKLDIKSDNKSGHFKECHEMRLSGSADRIGYPDIFVGALMGCRGDAYRAEEVLSENEAYEFHSWQAKLFEKEQVDFLYAGIMPALPEMIGMARAMGETGLPYIISFMIRDNGRLIDGTSIHEAILAVEQTVRSRPVTYMTNCVHPVHLEKALAQEFNQTELVRKHFQGIQANASLLSPEELDRCCDVVSSEPIELAREMEKLRNRYGLKIFGGCCGTNQYHMEEMAKRLSKQR